ncbi:MAG: hypothetical protein CEE38_23165 [Planctomycetes bacterium B3_Pla]|nr:MAG: hypothetical protein CEE38_23165 [Planctomycetes bacterium B3_Pla]
MGEATVGVGFTKVAMSVVSIKQKQESRYNGSPSGRHRRGYGDFSGTSSEKLEHRAVPAFLMTEKLSVDIQQIIPSKSIIAKGTTITPSLPGDQELWFVLDTFPVAS